MIPESEKVLVKYRTFWRRFFAGLVDAVIFLPLYLVESQALYGRWDTEILSERAYMHNVSIQTVVLLAALNYGLQFWYSIWMTGKFGQTIGKMATKIKVLDADTEANVIGLRRACYRDAPLIIFEFVTLTYMYLTMDITEKNPLLNILNFAAFIWILAELISMFQNVRRRAIHDYLAGSVVVRV